MLDPILADVFNFIADVAAAVTFGGMVVFIILYSGFYQWKKRRAGKSVLFLALALVVVAFVSVLALWIGPDYWLRPFWRMTAWLFAVYAVGYLIYALLYNWKNRHPIEIPRRDPNVKTSEIPVQGEK